MHDIETALRELVAAIAEVAAPPYPVTDPDPDVTRRHVEEFRDLQRDRAHQVASAARHVTEYDLSPEVIHSLARNIRRAADRPLPYPARTDPEGVSR